MDFKIQAIELANKTMPETSEQTIAWTVDGNYLQIKCFVSEHFYTISTSEEKCLTSTWSLPDALRLKSVILLSSYAPPYLLN